MACCAFALFIVGQIAAWLGGVRELLPARFRASAERPNHVTAWRLETAPAPVARGRRLAPRRVAGWVAVALALEIGLVGGAAYGLDAASGAARAAAGSDIFQAADAFICRTLGLGRSPG
jgi:hypothetical protein